jgi:two-component system, cell cycle sensor histidine kinase and response regulator CckA
MSATPPDQILPGHLALFPPTPLSTDESRAHLWFFERLDVINRAIQGTTDAEQIMSAVLDATLTIFDCDRAWLVYPCDPDAPVWSVAMARSRPDDRDGFTPRLELPMDPAIRDAIRAIHASGSPVTFGPGSLHAVPAVLAMSFHVQSQLATTIYPKIDKPYLFGLHACSYARRWTADEVRLFQEIGRRIADALTSALVHRVLRESERKLAEAQRITHVGYWDRSFDTDCIAWSEETFRIFGLPPEPRLLSVDEVLSLIHPDDRQPVLDQVVDAINTRQRLDVEYRVVRPDGELRIVHNQADVRFDESGRPRQIFGTVQDITDRRRQEDRLRASETRFRTFVDHAMDALFVHDQGGRLLDVNQQACVSLGYTRDELIGMSPDQFDPDVSLEFLEGLGPRLDNGEVIAFESRHRRKDGSVFPVEVRIRAFWQEGHRFAVTLVRDITERQHAQQALMASHSLLTAIVEGTSDCVFVKDLQGRYLTINVAGAHFLGKRVDEVIGRDDQALFLPEAAQRIMERDRQVMATGESHIYEETVTVAGLTRTYLATKSVYRDADGQIAGVIGISRDITELKRLEEQFRQAQKMEAVGRLAGGIAHDFNNLLTVINGCSELVFNGLNDHDPGRELLAEIRKAGERAANLTRQLLAFSRKQVLQPRIVSLKTLLGDLHKLLKRLIGEDIELVLTLDPVVGLTKVDPGQFEQAIINLVVNARDAMPQGGRLSIQIQNADLDDAYAAQRSDVRPGGYVLVAVRDSGIGMDDATKLRIFEPFFTTKEPGKGTGLGLAMVYGFVKQSGGHIEVYSERGYGTAFKIYLPRADEALLPTPAPVGLTIPKGTETVLLVEDEDAVRTLSKLVLQSNGYTVLEARDGQEAIWIARQHHDRIHILVTDLVMPRMSGREVADLLTRAKPHLRVLFMSGYTDEAVVREGALGAGVTFLQKPFSPIALARKVREVLDTKTAACD